MPSIEKASKTQLQKMVKGAARRAKRDKATSKKPQLKPEAIEKLKAQMQAHGKSIQKIPLELIDVDENIRERYDEAKLNQLAESLQTDGLIQFPSLCLRSHRHESKLICRNGHRRILAAKKLGWKTIECTIIPFDSAKEELYHTINANLREDVFYLDMAFAYEQASKLGETDELIAKRVGLNPRTIGWYRRLCSMSQSCQNLCRKYPDVFTATWAIKLARQGELPEARKLEKLMLNMLNMGSSKAKQETAHSAAKNQLKTWLGEQTRHHAFAKEFLKGLSEAGYLNDKALKKIEKNLFN